MKLRLLTAVSVGLLTAGVACADTTPAKTIQPAAATTAPAANTASGAANPTPMTTAAKPANTPNAPATNPSALTTDKEKVSYSIGVDLGTNFRMQSIDLNPTIFMRGIQDGLSGGNTLLTKQQMIETLTNFQKQMVAKKQAEFNALSTKNQQEGMAFLAANKTKPGIVTTANGLQYKVIQQGQGNPPGENDIVTVEYTGKDIHGKVFDSSAQHGKAVTFPISEVIPGWTEALKLMKPGATYEVYLPPNLAYGAHGLGPVIGPNQTLIFTIHLVSTKKPQPGNTATATPSTAPTQTAATTPAANNKQ